METDSDAGFLVFLAIWMGSIAHAGALTRGVLRSRAVALHRDAGYRRAAPEPSAPARPDLPAIPLPDGVRPLGDVHDGR